MKKIFFSKKLRKINEFKINCNNTHKHKFSYTHMKKKTKKNKIHHLISTSLFMCVVVFFCMKFASIDIFFA
jgi:hypothetical protein